MTMDKEERDILDSFDRDEWIPAKDREGEMTRFADIARGAEIKDCRINIRLSRKDLMRLKAIALREGIPYQTLIASVLHKYGAGVLNDDNRTAG